MSVNSDRCSPDITESSTAIVDVLIVGAGVGGLVTALCLHRCGFTVRVHEKSKVLDTTGYGLNLQPYSVKVLYELGFENELDKIGVRTGHVNYYTSTGQFIYREPRGLDAGYKWPMYSVHRGHFHELLLRRIRSEVGETSVVLDQRLLNFRAKEDYVEVDFINSEGHLTTEKGRVLIGAEGVHSTVRKILYPDEAGPLWNGTILWRGVSAVDKMYLDGRTMVSMGNPNQRSIFMFPVNEKFVNWTCHIRVANPMGGSTETPNSLSSVPSDWKSLVVMQDLLSLLSHLKLDFLDIHTLLSSSISNDYFPLTDRDPLPKWTHGRVTLLGDAAHPMYPKGGNGASQAILDAQALALSFRQHGATPQGLQAYEDQRRLPSSNVVLAGRMGGPDKLLEIVHERAPSGIFQNLSDVIFSSEIEAILSNYKQMAGWDPEKVNQAHPLS